MSTKKEASNSTSSATSNTAAKLALSRDTIRSLLAHPNTPADTQKANDKLRELFVKLSLKEARLRKNLSHADEVLLPNLRKKVPECEAEIVGLQEKKQKAEQTVGRLRGLSIELHRKLDDYVMESKRIQLEEHQRREVLSAEFAVKVKDVSGRLHDIETRKTELLNENFALREELAKCLERANAQQLEQVPSIDPTSDLVEELTVNRDHENMIHEDFRSACVQVCGRERALQMELGSFTDRFQELSDTIRANNAALLQQKTKSQEMDAAIVRLEKQYTRGREIYYEIKNVVTAQKANTDAAKAALDTVVAKRDKLKRMGEGLQTTVAELKEQVRLLHLKKARRQERRNRKK